MMVRVEDSGFCVPTPLLPPSASIREPHRNRAEKNGGNLWSNPLNLGEWVRLRSREVKGCVSHGHTANSGPSELKGACRDQYSCTH